MNTALHIAVIGAGPAGLALALHAAQALPLARITLFDARPADKDVSADARTLALSLGSVQLLQRLGVWPAALAQPILQVHVSQVPPSFTLLGREAAVRLCAQDEAVPMLGAVLRYGQLVAPMQAAWMAAVAREPGRLAARFGVPVAAIKTLDDGVELDAGVAERFDLAVVAEGGVFADQARKALTHDYHQLAWVGTIELLGATPGLAIERFTRHGPLALLPLPALAAAPAATSASAGAARAGHNAAAQAGRQSAALVWCVPDNDDPVAALSDAQRLAVLATLLPAEAGQIMAISPLKRFALGLNAERSLVDGCSVRIGNAAQTLHPVAGQGLNLGLRDAFELVQVLKREFGAGGADQIDSWDGGGPAVAATHAPRQQRLRAALRRVEWSRAPDRWAMIAATDFLARSFTWRWPGIGAARGLGLAAVQALPMLKSALARQMMFGRR